MVSNLTSKKAVVGFAAGLVSFFGLLQ